MDSQGHLDTRGFSKMLSPVFPCSYSAHVVAVFPCCYSDHVVAVFPCCYSDHVVAVFPCYYSDLVVAFGHSRFQQDVRPLHSRDRVEHPCRLQGCHGPPQAHSLTISLHFQPQGLLQSGASKWTSGGKARVINAIVIFFALSFLSFCSIS